MLRVCMYMWVCVPMYMTLCSGFMEIFNRITIHSTVSCRDLIYRPKLHGLTDSWTRCPWYRTATRDRSEHRAVPSEWFYDSGRRSYNLTIEPNTFWHLVLWHYSCTAPHRLLPPPSPGENSVPWELPRRWFQVAVQWTHPYTYLTPVVDVLSVNYWPRPPGPWTVQHHTIGLFSRGELMLHFTMPLNELLHLRPLRLVP